MHLEPTSIEHRQIFATWEPFSPIATRTCRPISGNGRRLPTDHSVVHWTFFVDRIESPVGYVQYFDLNPRNRSAELGYHVNPHYRNQGIGTQMVKMACDRLFSTTDLNKLYCQTGAFNTPSIKLLEKLGFHRDGCLREHHELDGKLWDDYLYSILRREWEYSIYRP